MPQPFGPLDINVLPAYKTKGRAGLAVNIRRCAKLKYIHKDTRDPIEDTCTRQRTVHVLEDTLQCYEQIHPALKELSKTKGGRPGITHKVFALIACNKSGRFKRPEIKEPMVPAVIAAVIRQPDEEIGAIHEKVKNNIELLKKTQRVVGDVYVKDIGEKSVSLPPTYQVIFNQFVKAYKKHPKTAKLIAPPEQWMYRVRGTRVIPIVKKGKGLPKTATVLRSPTGEEAGLRLTAPAIIRGARAEEEWRRRVGIRALPPRYRLYIPETKPRRGESWDAFHQRLREEGKATQAKIIRAPKRIDPWRGEFAEDAEKRQREREDAAGV